MTLRNAALTTLLAAAVGAGACTATRTQKSFGETVDDGTTTTRVKAALIADPASEARHIDVDTRRGVVQLNGFVNSDDGRVAAGRTAGAVSGVRAVENNLQLKGAERSAGTVVDDGVISTRVKLALAEDRLTKAYQIKVDTHGGHVQLGGWVDSAEMRTQAGRLAAKVEGVVEVENNLDVKH